MVKQRQRLSILKLSQITWNGLSYDDPAFLAKKRVLLVRDQLTKSGRGRIVERLESFGSAIEYDHPSLFQQA